MSEEVVACTVWEVAIGVAFAAGERTDGLHERLAEVLEGELALDVSGSIGYSRLLTGWKGRHSNKETGVINAPKE